LNLPKTAELGDENYLLWLDEKGMFEGKPVRA
jgi:hypothetical protein